MSESDTSLINTKVGDYKIQKELGVSSIGRVFLARQVSIERDVALVQISAKIKQNSVILDKIKAEVIRLSSLHQENLLACFGMEPHADDLYLIMEYYNAPRASDVLARKGPMPAREAINVVLQLSTGLEAMHAQGIIHGMIMPSNIIILESGVVKLRGLGVWNIFDYGRRLLQSEKLHKMHHCLSPEQCQGIEPDLSSDVYSLGAAFFHLVSGRPPFLAKNPAQIILYHKQETPVLASEVNTTVPESFATLISRMMQKRPADRPNSTGELIAELDRIFMEEMQASYKAVDQKRRSATGQFTASASIQADSLASEGLKGLRIAVKSQMLTKTEAEYILRLQQNYRRGVIKSSYASMLFEKELINSDNLCRVWRNYHFLKRTSEDKLFGRIAILNGLVDETTIQKAIAQQKTLLASSVIKRMGQILLELGTLDQKHVDSILNAQETYLRETEDRYYGNLAISKGFVTQKQLDECLEIQKTQQDLRIGDILYRKKYLPNQQRRWILDEQARHDSSMESQMFGKIAVHLKLISQDDMISTTDAWQRIEPVAVQKKLWEILLERAYLSQEEVDSLRKAMAKGSIVPQFRLKSIADIDQETGETPMDDSQSLKGLLIPCPHCNKMVDRDEPRCPFCMKNIKVASTKQKESPQTQVAAQADFEAGPWQVILPGARTSEGMSFKTLLSWVRSNRVQHNSSIRGPATNSQWQFAAEVQGVAREFGVCQKCRKRVQTDWEICQHCNSGLDALPGT